MTIPPIPNPLGAIAFGPEIAVLRAALDAIEAYLDALPLDCPRA